jgi:type IV pilus assembly protein PilC
VLIPSPIQQMLIASEQSGNLSGSLLKIGAIYEDKIEITTKSLTTIMEPVLLIIVWLGVVVVALGVITPLYSLLSGIN